MRLAKSPLLPLAIALSAAASPSANYVVIKAEGAAAGRYAAGTLLAAGTRLDLPAGSVLRLLGESGELLVVEGPARSLPASKGVLPGASTALKRLSRLVASGADGRPTLGAVRGSAGEVPADPWVIDTTGTGNQCLFSDRGSELWRPARAPAARVSLESLGTGEKKFVDWPEGVDRIPWPPEVPETDGGSYLFSTGGATARRFNLAIGKTGTPDGAALLFMVEHDCRAQAETLLGEMKAGAPRH